MDFVNQRAQFLNPVSVVLHAAGLLTLSRAHISPSRWLLALSASVIVLSMAHLVPLYSPTLWRTALNREKAFSIGLQSGVWGSRKRRVVPVDSILSFTAARLWRDRLSMMTSSLGRNPSPKTCATFASN